VHLSQKGFFFLAHQRSFELGDFYTPFLYAISHNDT
jgi:hypothetical protein